MYQVPISRRAKPSFRSLFESTFFWSVGTFWFYSIVVGLGTHPSSLAFMFYVQFSYFFPAFLLTALIHAFITLHFYTYLQNWTELRKYLLLLLLGLLWGRVWRHIYGNFAWGSDTCFIQLAWVVGCQGGLLASMDFLTKTYPRVTDKDKFIILFLCAISLGVAYFTPNPICKI